MGALKKLVWLCHFETAVAHTTIIAHKGTVVAHALVMTSHMRNETAHMRPFEPEEKAHEKIAKPLLKYLTSRVRQLCGFVILTSGETIFLHFFTIFPSEARQFKKKSHGGPNTPCIAHAAATAHTGTATSHIAATTVHT